MERIGSSIDLCLEGETLRLENGLLSARIADVLRVEYAKQDGEGRLEPYWEITAYGKERTRRFCVWEDLPLVYAPAFREEAVLTLTGEHWIARSVRLCAFSDDNDTLTSEREQHLFAGNLFSPMEGELFFLEDPESQRAWVLISETPDYQTATLRIRGGVVTLENGGNGLALGACRMGECEALCRSYLRHARRISETVSMSNTWGDGNGFSRVCREFVLREVDAAADIGVDIVQIDDGWQTGSTADKTRRDEKGRRVFLGDFWELDRSKFPGGIEEITAYAAERGVRVGLWFAPDSHDGYALLERDTAVLERAYREWGARFFKLDMFWILSDTDRDRFLELLRRIYALGSDVAAQIDVTRNARLNYLCGRQYGSVFVENRYTKSANSFPHRILRNLWMLSRYLPTTRFQFEVVNPDLNQERYSPSDPFAPSLYDMDYLFATVMLSNPLFWMEMQFLSDARREQIKPLVSLWKEHRRELAVSDIAPIGEKPSGRSITGFLVAKQGTPTYLLVFREVTDRGTHRLSLPLSGNETATLLASNAEASLTIREGEVELMLSKPRAYAFYQLHSATNS